MKRTSFLIVLFVLTIGLLGSCGKDESLFTSITGRNIVDIPTDDNTVTVIPALNDGSFDLSGFVLTINCAVKPETAVSNITDDNVKVLVKKSGASGYETLAVLKLLKNAVTGEITVRADISSFVPIPAGQSLMAAVEFTVGGSVHTTDFFPVRSGSGSNVEVTDDGGVPMINISSDPDLPKAVGGEIPVSGFSSETKPTVINLEGIGRITFDEESTAKIKENAEAAGATDIFFKVEDVTTTKPVPNADVVYEVTMKAVNEEGTEVFCEGKEAGVVTVEVPLEDDIVYVNEVTLVDNDGNRISGGVVPGSEKLENNVLIFQVNHFSKYAIDYVKKADYVSVTGVNLNKNTLSLITGGTETLIATVLPEKATNKNVTWSSSNNAVATVEGGKVTVVSAGTATITVTTADGAKTATCAVTVNNPVVNVTDVTLNKDKVTLIVGGTETLIATVTPENATNKNVTWSSSNDAVATVEDGKVTAVSAGTATITVTTVDGGKTATCAVTVNNPVVNVTGVALNKNTMTLIVGGTETLTATVLPENATNKNVTWKSDNEAVATVGSDGKVTAVSAGTATITVTTADGGKTATCAVTVNNPVVNVTGVALNKNTMTLIVGGTETLTATVLPENATDKNVTWSSSNTAVATVGNDGKVTAVSAGTTTITVTTADGAKTATCAVTVVVPVTGVALNKTALTLKVGSNETLTATVNPTNATNKDVTWSSSNDAVATVEDGKVTAVAHGTATITVTTVDGGKTATCTVKVTTGAGFGEYGDGGNI